MKLSELKRATSSSNPPQPSISVYIPPLRGSEAERNVEVSLASGRCPLCECEVTAELDRILGKVFYQCVGNMWHFFSLNAE